MPKGSNYKVKPQSPVSVIIHGGDYLGYLLAQTLVEQGSQVIIIDKFTSKSKKYLNQLKKEGDVTFINFKSSKTFLENLSRIDYLYYKLNSKVEETETFDSKNFLEETENLSTALKIGQKFKSKISLITSLRLNRELANRVNNENLSQPSPYSNIELQKYCENLTAEFRDKTKLNLRIIRLGTVLGKGIEKISDSQLHKLLLDGVKDNQLEIIGEGLDIHNIIDESDAIYGILKLTFSEKTKGDVISLANKSDYTTLSLAYKLLELNVTAQSIKFKTDENAQLVLQDLYVPAPHASKYGWKQQSTLEDTLINQIHEYFESSSQKWDIPTKSKVSEEKNTVEVKTKKGRIVNKVLGLFQKESKEEKLFLEINYKKILFTISSLIFLFFLIYFLLSPVLGIGIGGYIIYSDAKKLRGNVTSYNFEQAQKNLDRIDNHFIKIKDNTKRLTWVFNILGDNTLLEELDKIFLSTEYALDAGESLITGLKPLALYIKDFEPAISFDVNNPPNTTREYRDYLEDMETYSYLTSDGAYKFDLAKEIISTVNSSYFPKFSQDYVLQIKGLIKDGSEGVDALSSIIDFLPDILGNSERKRYLILLQNQGELRSTGGWISSYGIVGLEGGQIRELFVDDIYNADGNLQVENKTFTPPQSLVNALETTDYSFSLVNWEPDLYEVMIESEKFVNALGKGNDLDGVITIDIRFIQTLLDSWGGIEVPGESELITSENIYSKIFEMHNEFTPGSDRKSTFMANLANQTVTRLLSSDFSDYSELASVFSNSLEEKHLQAVFKNSNATEFFDNRNWDGRLDRKYLSSPIPIEWNWGGNKANLYIKRDHNLDVEITEDSITYTYEINTVNESAINTYPEGNYINYIRIYLPKEATILNIKGIEDNEYDIYDEGDFKVVGGWFNILIQDSNTLIIKYRISDTDIEYPIERQNDNVFYKLNIYKQPGTKKESYVLSVTYPESWNIIESEDLTSISNQLNRRFDLVSDTEFDITWSTL
jgi:nucleoside-diphosphate-sugar epimerase